MAGFSYEVSDDMLERFARSTILQRLQWLDEMQRFTWSTASEATRQEWRRLRAGATAIDVLSGQAPPKK